jgi:predicted nucleic acid-binding Zn ribbon protein
VHDPTGLELARSVAARLRAAGRARTGKDGGRVGGSGSQAWAGRRGPRSVDPQFSGARPDDRDPQRIQTAVERLVADSGWSTEVSVHTVLGRWPHIVGADVARHCTPVGYAETVVAVAADSTAWATQLRLLAATVVARLNAELGDGTVTRISVQGPGAPSWRSGRRVVKGRGPRDTYG